MKEITEDILVTQAADHRAGIVLVFLIDAL